MVFSNPSLLLVITSSVPVNGKKIEIHFFLDNPSFYYVCYDKSVK